MRQHAVGEHRALRPAGRAGGVEQPGEVVAVARHRPATGSARTAPRIRRCRCRSAAPGLPAHAARSRRRVPPTRSRRARRNAPGCSRARAPCSLALAGTAAKPAHARCRRAVSRYSGEFFATIATRSPGVRPKRCAARRRARGALGELRVAPRHARPCPPPELRGSGPRAQPKREVHGRSAVPVSAKRATCERESQGLSRYLDSPFAIRAYRSRRGTTRRITPR